MSGLFSDSQALIEGFEDLEERKPGGPGPGPGLEPGGASWVTGGLVGQGKE